MEELLFIINPVAGSGKAEGIKTIIEENMKKYSGDFSIVLTKTPKEATQIAYKSNIERIIAVGGDGTVTEVAKGIIKRGYGILGIIPGGTGNDFIKSVGIPKDVDKALKIIIDGKTKEIDIGIANGYKFLNIGSVGLDADVTHNAQNLRKYIKGSISYILSIFITLFNFRKKKAIIEIDGKIYKRNLVLFAIGNGKFYGSGLKMIPNANLNDGYLHSCLVRDVSNLRIVTIFPEIFQGTHLRHKKYVETFKSKKVKIKFNEDTYMNLDGDIFCPGRQVEFSISDKRLHIIVP